MSTYIDLHNLAGDWTEGTNDLWGADASNDVARLIDEKIERDGTIPFTGDQSLGGNDLTNVGSVQCDTVVETTPNAGVTIDGVLLKDFDITLNGAAGRKVKRELDTQSLLVCGGTTNSPVNGSWLSLNGESHATLPGDVYLNTGTSGSLYLRIGTTSKLTINNAGAVTTASTVNGRTMATDGAKLDGIETGATADQTAAEILTAIKTVDGAGSGLDADLLDAQSSAYYLARANHTGAMDESLDLGGNGLLNFLGGGDITGFKFGSYSGNDTNNRNITTGFAPDVVIIWSSGTNVGFLFSDHTNAHYFSTATAGGAAVSTSWLMLHATDGFIVGTVAPDFNAAPLTYQYIAFKFS